MRKLVTIVQTVGEDDSDSEIFNRKELGAKYAKEIKRT
jgi:hypothetical protein